MRVLLHVRGEPFGRPGISTNTMVSMLRGRTTATMLRARVGHPFASEFDFN